MGDKQGRRFAALQNKHRTLVDQLPSSWKLLQVWRARPVLIVRNWAQAMQTPEWPDGCTRVTVP